jgi:hypothetical protein
MITFILQEDHFSSGCTPQFKEISFFVLLKCETCLTTIHLFFPGFVFFAKRQNGYLSRTRQSDKTNFKFQSKECGPEIKRDGLCKDIFFIQKKTHR